MTTENWAQTFVSDAETEYFINYCIEAMRNHPRNKQGQAILLIGEAGAGKSALLRAVVRRAGRELAQKGAKRGAAMIEMPIPCTNRAISLEFRRSLGDEAKSGGTTDNMDVVKTLWRGLGTEFMAVDEGHNMGSDKVDYAQSKRQFVKRVLNDFKGICAFAGTPALLPLFTSDKELRRRTRRVWHIPAWDWHDPISRKGYRKYLRKLDEATGMPKLANLGELDRAGRCAAATGCQRGLTYDLVNYARGSALSRGSDQITDADLETAFFESIALSDEKVVNPFDPNQKI